MPFGYKVSSLCKSRLIIFNDRRFNDTLTDDVISFEQLGPGVLFIIHVYDLDNINYRTETCSDAIKTHHSIFLTLYLGSIAKSISAKQLFSILSTCIHFCLDASLLGSTF